MNGCSLTVTDGMNILLDSFLQNISTLYFAILTSKFGRQTLITLYLNVTVISIGYENISQTLAHSSIYSI